MLTKCSFDAAENKLDYYRERDCIENLCKKLKEHAMEIISQEEEEIIPLTDEENQSYEKQEVCHICIETFCLDENDENSKNRKRLKNTGKFRGAAHIICSLGYKVSENIPMVIHNASYDTHFIINLDCIGENMEKYITFSVPIKKECYDVKTITWKLTFIDSFRFKSASLSDLINNLAGIFNAECKSCIQRKKIKSECVYPFEDMYNWENFYETTIPPKQTFNSKLNEEGITDKYYAHVKKVWKVFKIKNCGEYHELYAQSDTLYFIQ